MALTKEGYKRPSFTELVSQREQLAKELFGEDIETGERTPLGKFIRIGAYDLAKAYEDVEQIYYARFPNTATGISLDRLCVFAGISRNPAKAAEHQIEITGVPGAVIPMEFLVGTPERLLFYTTANCTIGEDGKGTAQVICQESGVIGNVAVGEISEIINPSAEVTAIRHLALLNPGEELESDLLLRRRFAVAITGAGATNADAIRAAIARVPTVESVSVVENNTDSADDAGRPPHSFECFVYGGEEYHSEIARAIFEKQPIGIRAVSTAAEKDRVNETVLDSGGYPHSISFSHTATVTIKLQISIKTNSKFGEHGTEEIRSNLLSYIDQLGVGGTLVLTALYGHIYNVLGVTEATVSASYSEDGTSFQPISDAFACTDWQVPVTRAELVEVTVIS